jgi:hypothetical protein
MVPEGSSRTDLMSRYSIQLSGCIKTSLLPILAFWWPTSCSYFVVKMRFSRDHSNASSLFFAFLATLTSTVLASDDQCRCFPGDECWPSASKWSSFNETLGGKLIATVPLAAVCHNSNSSCPDWPAYDEEACSQLQQRWCVIQNNIRSL